MLVALEEGTVDLDEPAGPPGATLRHLLSHASGLPLDGEEPLAEPGRRRIYSNTGIERRCRAARASGRRCRSPTTSPRPWRSRSAWPAVSTARPHTHTADRSAICSRSAASSRADARRGRDARRSGVRPVPGPQRRPARFRPDGAERLGSRPSSSATGRRRTGPARATPKRTFGHFGRSGTFLWVDPDAGLACGVLTDRQFGDWAKEAWPPFSDAVLAEASSRRLRRAAAPARRTSPGRSSPRPPESSRTPSPSAARTSWPRPPRSSRRAEGGGARRDRAG